MKASFEFELDLTMPLIAAFNHEWLTSWERAFTPDEVKALEQAFLHTLAQHWGAQVADLLDTCESDRRFRQEVMRNFLELAPNVSRKSTSPEEVTGPI